MMRKVTIIKGKRHDTRQAAVQALYHGLVRFDNFGEPLNSNRIIREYLAWREEQLQKISLQTSFFMQLLRKAVLQSYDENLSLTARAIVMVARAEMAEESIKTPTKVILSEYVNLAAQLCDDHETAVVNGCLDS